MGRINAFSTGRREAVLGRNANFVGVMHETVREKKNG
jgi:hypothetical protein